MNTEKYNRTISLNCPSCGCTQFSTEEGTIKDALLVTCTNCGLEISKENLETANSENIEEHLKEIKKSLQDAVKGSQFIKIK